MGIAIHCAYCLKPLVDADHARAHVVNQCEKSPTKVLADALEGLVQGLESAGEVNPDWPRLASARAALVTAGRTKN